MIRTTKALNPDGTPTGVTDERGVLLDLTSRDVEELSKAGGDPAAYLQERRRQIAAAEEKRREADDFERYRQAFVEAGGNASDAKASYEAMRRGRAAEAAERSDRAALHYARAGIRGRL